MIAVANEEALYLLEFEERRGLKEGVERFQKRIKSEIVPGKTKSIDSIENELIEYFKNGAYFS